MGCMRKLNELRAGLARPDFSKFYSLGATVHLVNIELR